MTDYVILQLNDEAKTWAEVAIIRESSSARRAIATAALTPGTYVAVPHRSWKSLKVTVEQTTKITIG